MFDTFPLDRKCGSREDFSMQLEPGTYTVGYFGSVAQENNFMTLRLRVSADENAYAEGLSIRPFNQKTGQATVEEGIKAGDLVIVRTFESIQGFDKKDKDTHELTGERGSFIKRQAISVSLA
jgi:hypothetical protein